LGVTIQNVSLLLLIATDLLKEKSKFYHQKKKIQQKNKKFRGIPIKDDYIQLEIEGFKNVQYYLFYLGIYFCIFK